MTGPGVVAPADPKPGPAAQVDSTLGASFVQVSIHVTSHGKAQIHEVAIASLPGDPRTKVEIEGDSVTLTHACDVTAPRANATKPPAIH